MKYSLNKFKGSWSRKEAAHLLRRTVFGFSALQLEDCLNKGLFNSVDYLLREETLPSPPINYKNKKDESVGIGETWVGVSFNYASDSARKQSLKSWQIGQIVTATSIREKMTLFWHNHFVAFVLYDANFLYQYISTLRKNATGNFKQLTKEITIDPTMLRYLNGNLNIKASPNENYARELLELFTIGRGDYVGNDDYTTYTEKDITSIARSLTGWKEQGYKQSENQKIGSVFHENLHDDKPKKLSHRFNGYSIENEGEHEYSEIIDVLFSQNGSGKHVCRKLYRWFVNSSITDAIEEHIITELADILAKNNFEIKPVLKALLLSEHFFEENNIGAIIKSPIDFVASIYKSFGVTEIPIGLTDKITFYKKMERLHGSVSQLGMHLFFHPQVIGWKPYHQQPYYDKYWITTDSIIKRQSIIDAVLRNHRNAPIDNYLKFIDSFDAPDNLNELIKDLSKSFLVYPLDDAQVDYIKSSAEVQLTSEQWNKLYSTYSKNKEDLKNARIVEKKLFKVLNLLLKIPEIHSM